MPSQAISTSPSAAGSALPSRIGEVRGDAAAALLDAGAAMPGDEIVRRRSARAPRSSSTRCRSGRSSVMCGHWWPAALPNGSR